MFDRSAFIWFMSQAMAVVGKSVDQVMDVPEDGALCLDIHLDESESFVEIDGPLWKGDLYDFWMSSDLEPEWDLGLQDRSGSGGAQTVMCFRRGSDAIEVLVKNDEDSDFQGVCIEFYRGSDADNWVADRLERWGKAEIGRVQDAFVHISSRLGHEKSMALLKDIMVEKYGVTLVPAGA